MQAAYRNSLIWMQVGRLQMFAAGTRPSLIVPLHDSQALRPSIRTSCTLNSYLAGQSRSSQYSLQSEIVRREAMEFFNALFTLLFTLLAVIRAAPTVATIDCTQHAPRECNPSRYTIEWFLRCTKPTREQLITDRALFYSAGAGPAAKALRHSPKSNRFYVTIWDFCKLTRFVVRNRANRDVAGQQWTYNNSTTSSVSCIHNDENLRYKYYSAMSAAFARLARESATIMHLDPNNPPKSGIWPPTEYPTLRVATDVAQFSLAYEKLYTPLTALCSYGP